MIYVTGDTHANIDIAKLNTTRFPQQKELTKNDFVIICGDFGLCWDGSHREMWWQDWLTAKNFTTLWIDGNHENFDMLYQFPLIDKFGGKVREIAPDIYHLDRGQVLTIDGKKIFCMGGARSVDKEYRVEHISWWKEEMPSREEMERAIVALEQNNWCVDYVITHCAFRLCLQAGTRMTRWSAFWIGSVPTSHSSGGSLDTIMWTSRSMSNLLLCIIK